MTDIEQQTIPGIPVPRRRYTRSPLRILGANVARVIAAADELERAKVARTGRKGRPYSVGVRVVVRDKDAADQLAGMIESALMATAKTAKHRAAQMVKDAAEPDGMDSRRLHLAQVDASIDASQTHGGA